MHRWISIAAICFFIFACHHRLGEVGQREDNVSFSPGIVESDISAHVKMLASDAFEGRAPGTHGEQLTTDYLVRQFKRIGLQPGNHGSWMQGVPFVKATLLHPDQIRLAVAGSGGTSELAFGDDMLVTSPQDLPHAAIRNSPIVFLGYGVDAPGQLRNDYAGLDLKGKTVVLLVNEPGWRQQDPMLFKGRKLSWYGHKLQEAASHGAAAAFIVHDTAAVGFPWQVVQNNRAGPQISLPASEDPRPRLPIAGWLTTAAARKLFADAGVDFDALKKTADQADFKPVALDATASIAIDSSISTGQSNNVIGEVPGRKRPWEAVIYSAHWDHLGRDGKRIFNGAVDNASSVAGLLEIAEAFAHRRPTPDRTVMFIALTMEESGLLGSRYYIHHPLVPLDLTVAEINTDALTVVGPSRDIVVIGHGQSQLDEYVTAAARMQHRTVTPDQIARHGFFARSGQFNFAMTGVPVLYARSGLDLREGGIPAGRKAYDEYIANRYHRTSDTFDPHWDLRGLVQDLRLLYMVGNKLSGEATFPQWKPGSDFRRAGMEAR